MSARRFGTQSLVRLLGNWQETSSRTPLWRQLAEALRLLILDGRLTLQTRLPGERELAAEYFPRWRFSPPEGGLSFWVELPDMLATLFSARAESQGIHIGTGTRFGLEGAFDRYLRLPFTLPDEALRRAFSTLQPLWQSLAEQKENTRLRKII
ncbi:TPA: GntR family transcriptional regulator [Klebsiella pneumoniae]|nr:GntR family transcriptional regulator [Klebsiella pneumoniae]HCB1299733.1 GntR family transcriptional regulator [Klebsiella pneumoniae]